MFKCILKTLLISIVLKLNQGDVTIHQPHEREIVLPTIGLGTAGLGGSTAEVVSYALELGVRLIDSAQAQEWYNEKDAGKAILHFEQANSLPNTDIKVLTKIHPRSYELAKMESKLKESKINFHRDHLDVVLLHAPWCWPGSCTAEEERIIWHTGWKNLEQLKNDMNILEIGVSNFHLDILQDLVLNRANSKVSVIQNWMDPFHQDKEVRAFAKEHGIKYMAYSSFGTQWGRKGGNPVFSNPVLQNIARKHNATVAQVVQAWVLAEDAIVIPRSSKKDHLEENFAGLSGGDNKGVILDKSDLIDIRALDGSIGSPWD